MKHGETKLTMPINNECLIFDSLEMNTVNGLPLGALAPSTLVGVGDSQIRIDLGSIVNKFHADADGQIFCKYSNKLADGIRTIDGNPANFLITNLEPINSEYLLSQTEHLPKTRTILNFDDQDDHFEFELYGRFSQVMKGSNALQEIPCIPANIYNSIDKVLLWLWNYSSKKLLVKGLTKVTVKRGQQSISLSYSDVMEHLVQILQNPKYRIN